MFGLLGCSRNLSPATVSTGDGLIRRFQLHSGEFPWRWTPAHLEEWTTDLRDGFAAEVESYVVAGGVDVVHREPADGGGLLGVTPNASL